MAAPKDEFLIRLRYWLVHRRDDHHGDRLRDHDQAHDTALREAKRAGGVDLALPDRQDAALDDLGDETRRIGRKCREQRDELRHQDEAAAIVEAAQRGHVPTCHHAAGDQRRDRQHPAQHETQRPHREIAARSAPGRAGAQRAMPHCATARTTIMSRASRSPARSFGVGIDKPRRLRKITPSRSWLSRATAGTRARRSTRTARRTAAGCCARTRYRSPPGSRAASCATTSASPLQIR